MNCNFRQINWKVNKDELIFKENVKKQNEEHKILIEKTDRRTKELRAREEEILAEKNSLEKREETLIEREKQMKFKKKMNVTKRNGHIIRRGSSKQNSGKLNWRKNRKNSVYSLKKKRMNLFPRKKMFKIKIRNSSKKNIY